MKKVKRILAGLLAVFLVGLYAATFISACFATPATGALFQACLFSTMAVPILIFAYTLIYRILKNSHVSQEETEETEEKR